MGAGDGRGALSGCPARQRASLGLAFRERSAPLSVRWANRLDIGCILGTSSSHFELRSKYDANPQVEGPETTLSGRPLCTKADTRYGLSTAPWTLVRRYPTDQWWLDSKKQCKARLSSAARAQRNCRSVQVWRLTGTLRSQRWGGPLQNRGTAIQRRGITSSRPLELRSRASTEFVVL